MFRYILLFPLLLSAQRIEVRHQSSQPLDGRLIVMLATSDRVEPRFQVSAESKDPAATYGVDVEGWKAGAPAVVDGKTFGFPVRSLAQLPAGTYYLQALLHKYETFRRADGRVLKLPMDRGEGQQWNRAPGNLLSQAVAVQWAPGKALQVTLDREIPALKPPADTKYVKHIRIQSERLTKFWGRPMHLGAIVLLPEGWDTHPTARYPLAVFHGHFAATIGNWREMPPDDNLKPTYSERFRVEGYNRIEQQMAYALYREWTGPDFPRVIAVEIQHANPFYDDSYAVNSANLGPYGDAITYELIPHIEKTFRGLGQGWARGLYGGSTGGWEALAVQIFYPDEYNVAYGACPDPIDFRAYTTIDLYGHQNAFFMDSVLKRTPRPSKRNYLGEVSATQEEMNHWELVLGTKSRSGQQFDIWEAVYSPVGPDGYPARIFDKVTGVIDPKVAAYWRENYDLGHILKRDWNKGLGAKLKGKLNVYCGDMDNFYLNNAVYLVEDFLKTTDYGGEVTYGDRAEHCWNGDPTRPNHLSRLRYHQMFIPRMVERILVSAPVGADLTSWRY
jgi:hypothetical protein